MCCKDDLHGDTGAKIFWNSQPQGSDWVRRTRWKINQSVITTRFIWLHVQYIWIWICMPPSSKAYEKHKYWNAPKWDKSSSHWVMDLVNDWFFSTESPFNVLSGRSSQAGLYLHIRSEHRVIKITSPRVPPLIVTACWPLIGQPGPVLASDWSVRVTPH